jgi:DNA-binding CsgD family transcriptional regulator
LGSVLTNPGSGSGVIKEIIKDLKFHSNTQVWDEFESTFLKVHPEFFKSLAENFPSLTNNERKLCAFIRLNLSTKDISNITHQSLHTITVARTRLRKKLGLSNTGENLSGFLSKV